MVLNRIGIKLILTVAVLLAAEAAVRMYFDASANAEGLRGEFMKNGRFHAAGVARAAELGLLTRDPKELEKAANLMRTADDADLLYVAFYDEGGNLLASRQWAPHTPVRTHTRPVADVTVRRCPEEDPAHDGHYEFCVPVYASGAAGGPTGQTPASPQPRTGTPETAATVVVCRSDAGILARAAEGQREMLLLSAAVFLSFMVAFLGLSRRLVHPLRVLAKGTERVAAGNLGTRVDVGRRSDELGTLARAFNRMTEQLRRQRDQILSHNRELERKVADRTAELAAANQRLQALAVTDELTGLWNRRRFFEALQQETLRVQRHGTSLALAVLDVDHFKAVNDTYGHACGDRTLAEIAAVLRAEARQTDVVARYGGEEFVILMPDTTAEEAAAAVERIRANASLRTTSDGKHPLHITLSAGVSAIHGRANAGAETLLSMADEALYAAKHAGRDCTRSSGQVPVV